MSTKPTHPDTPISPTLPHPPPKKKPLFLETVCIAAKSIYFPNVTEKLPRKRRPGTSEKGVTNGEIPAARTIVPKLFPDGESQDEHRDAARSVAISIGDADGAPKAASRQAIATGHVTLCWGEVSA